MRLIDEILGDIESDKDVSSKELLGIFIFIVDEMREETKLMREINRHLIKIEDEFKKSLVIKHE
jgi:hypothetical protein